jgi:hypothetical protein
MIRFTPLPIYSRVKSPEPVWKLWNKRKILHCQEENYGRPAGSPSVHWLSYPTSKQKYYPCYVQVHEDTETIITNDHPVAVRKTVESPDYSSRPHTARWIFQRLLRFIHPRACNFLIVFESPFLWILSTCWIQTVVCLTTLSVSTL